MMSTAHPLSPSSLDRHPSRAFAREISTLASRDDPFARASSPAGPAPRLGPTPAELRARIAECFRAYDRDDKAWLDRRELECAFAALTGHPPAEQEADHVQSRCARGEVDFRFFSAYMEDRLSPDGRGPTSRAEHVRSIFRAFDVRRAGYISLDDAIDAFAVAVPAVSPAVVADVFAAADVDGDGKVSREEFAALLAGGSGTGHTTHT